jgi:hypothetical protein
MSLVDHGVTEKKHDNEHDVLKVEYEVWDPVIHEGVGRRNLLLPFHQRYQKSDALNDSHCTVVIVRMGWARR